MTNTVLVARNPVSQEQLEELFQAGFAARVLQVFSKQVDPKNIAVINALDWPKAVVLEDDLFEELEGIFRFPSHRLSDVCPGILRSAGADAPKAPEGNILFVPCNDTHVRMFLPIAKHLNDRHFLVIRGENADTYLSEHDEPFERLELKLFQGDKYKEYLRRLLKRLGTTVVVFANDWVGENWRICEVCKEIGVATVCIQEGPQDYELDDGKWRQMRYAEYVFSQGAITLQYLDTQRFYVSGNSRLSFYGPVPLPERDNIMINCNFTYKVYEDWRDRWIEDCVSACDGMQLPYFISQHPRDNGSFPNYNVIRSDAFKIIDQIHSANVLITRFSQVLYEAMLSGRQVIYYNPHRETKKVLTEDRSGAFFFAHDRDSLQEALREAVRRDFRNTEERREFLKLHCGPCDGKEVERILQGLAHLSRSKTSGASAAVGTAEKEIRSIESNTTAKKLRSIVKRHGPYTAQNMELASGVYTLDEKTNYDHFKVNRVKQLVADNGYLTRGTRLMDIASLQSMFAIEFAMEGLDVLSIEGRADNLEKGRFAAECFNLENIEFHQDDVNNIHPDKYGTCDVVLCMGILYHIAKDKYLDFLKNVSLCCDDVLILDTFVSLHDDEFLEVDGTRYLGSSWREYDDDTTEEDRVKSAHSSLNNPMSFSMTKDCLVAYLSSLGFTTLSEVLEPEQPDQPLDRLTLLCRKGTKRSLNVFPKFNFRRDFEQATDSRGTQSNNVVFWNLPRGNGKNASFTAISKAMEASMPPGKSAQALSLYDEVFGPLRAESLNIVEIGTRDAGSLLLLAKYFLKSNILGISQDKPSPELYAELNRSDVAESVHLAVGNPTDRPLIDRVLDAHFGKADIDIIIDNSSHRYDFTKATFEHLFPDRLRRGGHYVIESWGCGYWPMWVDGDPDGLHGLPLFVKELIDEVALADRTKVFKGKQALSSETIQSPSVRELRVAAGTVVITRA